MTEIGKINETSLTNDGGTSAAISGTYQPENDLEPDHVVQAEYFLESCLNEAYTANNNAAANGCQQSANISEKAVGGDNTTKVLVPETETLQKPRVTPAVTRKRKKTKSVSNDNTDSSNDEDEKMDVTVNKKRKKNSKNAKKDGGSRDDDGEGEEEKEYVVEKILDKRYNRKFKRIEYLIKWWGYDSESENTWEPECASDAIRKFEKKLKNKKTKTTATTTTATTTKRYPIRSRQAQGTDSNDSDEGTPPQRRSLRRKVKEIKTESLSELSSNSEVPETDDDNAKNELRKRGQNKSKSSKIDRILGVKKENNEIVALVRFEDGHHDLISTRILVNKCPKKLVNYYENLLVFVSPETDPKVVAGLETDLKKQIPQRNESF